jgi:ABC-type branched-subunit amino acid transport system substrate-binding protein
MHRRVTRNERRRAPAVACVLTAIALVAACGARTDPYLGAGEGVTPGDAQNASAAGPGETVPGATVPEGGGAGPSGAGSGGAAAPRAAPGASPVVAGPKGFNYDPAAEAGLCTGTAGNTASDVGVTPTSITLGNVSGLTGVITNSFEQGPQAVQALFAAVNAKGGICGRQLRLVVQDDGQDASRNAANHADLIPKVFAFVGSTTHADNAAVQQMVDAKVPDIGFAINANRGQSPVFWSAGGSTLYTQNGRPHGWNSLHNGLKKYNSFPKRLAVLAYAIPISADAARQFAYSFKREGSTICYENYSISPATASLDQDVLQMKQNNCDGVYTTMDLAGNAKLLQAQQRQDWRPMITNVTFSGYTKSQIQVAGKDAAQGLQVTLQFMPFTENNPVMKLYLSQLKTYQPGKEPSSFGLQAYAGAQMFIYALLKAGRNPTRASLTSALEALENYDSGGIMSPIAPRLRRPTGPCIVQVEVKGDEFVRKWPPSGMFCEAELLPTGP